MSRLVLSRNGETPGQAYEDEDEEEEEDQYDEEYGNVAPDGSALHAGWGASSTAPPYALPSLPRPKE
eukprot:COSAG01_NODE_6726_length_3526_cov_68.199883_2_plen_67_part_00